MAKRYFYQDAITGKIVPEKVAKANPNTTIKHSYSKKTKKNTKPVELSILQTICYFLVESSVSLVSLTR